MPHARAGFTLVELLVTMAILALLASLLYAVYPKAREKARAITCLSNQRQIAMAILMYVQDSQEYFPPNDADPWPGKITQYGADAKLFDCPSSTAGGALTHADYAMNASLAGQRMVVVEDASHTVLTVDTHPGTAFFTDTADYAPRHLGRCNVSYVDGHSGAVVP